RLARTRRIDHIHAVWTSTPATVAMGASIVSGIPWSCTGHRWDIEEDNLLGPKAARASFVRAISRRGARSLAQKTGAEVELIHVGVRLPACGLPCRPTGRIVIAANLLPLKGPPSRPEPAGGRPARGPGATLAAVGAGPGRAALGRQVQDSGLGEAGGFGGRVGQETFRRDRAGAPGTYSRSR